MSYRVLISILVVLSSVSAAAAQSIDYASTPFYGRFDIGFSSAADPDLAVPAPLPAELGDSVLFGFGAGYVWSQSLRADFTLSFHPTLKQVSGFPQMPEGRADFNAMTGLITAYYDAQPWRGITPFAGLGFGFSRNKLSTVQITNMDGSPLGTIEGATKTNFAWQIALGGSMELQGPLSLEFGYHYVSGGEYKSEDTLRFVNGDTQTAPNTDDFSAHELQVGVRYHF